MKAIVLVKFNSLETRDAYRLLKRLKPVTEAHMAYGRYDAVAFVQAHDLEEIRHVILSEIQPIPGVIETLPCILVEDEFQTPAGQGYAHPP